MAVNDDLTRILQILSASTEVAQAASQPLPPVRSDHVVDDDDDSYSPPPAITPDPRQTYPPPSVHVPEEALDPSRIEEWSEALRYVMRELNKNEAIMAGIKKVGYIGARGIWVVIEGQTEAGLTGGDYR